MTRPAARAIFLWTSAVALVTVVVVFRAVLLPFILALVIAYVLSPAVTRVERLRMPRWVAVLVVYAVTIGALFGFGALVVPRLAAEGQALRREIPALTSKLRDHWLPAMDKKLLQWAGQVNAPAAPPSATPAAPPAPVRLVPREEGAYELEINDGVQVEHVREGVWRLKPVDSARRTRLDSARMVREAFERAVGYVRENSIELLRIGQQIVGAIARGVFLFFLTLMLAAYIMLSRERILEFLRALALPTQRPSFDRLVHRLDRGLSGVVRGQLLICLVNGVLSAIGFWIFNLKYWPILSVLAGMLSIIPIFGSIISSIPAVAIGLTQSFGTGFAVLVWIVLIHQLEANFLNPKIIGDAAKIHPVLVVFALLAGEHFFQITGALFAVPCLSIVQTLFLHFRESALGLPDPTATTPPPAPVPDADAPPSTWRPAAGG